MRLVLERGVPQEERHKLAIGSLTDWDAARVFLVEQFDEEFADLLLEVHPRAVIEGRPLQISSLPMRLKKRKRWFYFGTSRKAS